MKIDEETVFYNIEIRREYSLTQKMLVKVIHLLEKNILIVLTEREGHQVINKMMRKFFKF